LTRIFDSLRNGCFHKNSSCDINVTIKVFILCGIVKHIFTFAPRITASSLDKATKMSYCRLAVMPAPFHTKYRSGSTSDALLEIHDSTAVVRSHGIAHAFAEQSGKIFLLYGARPVFFLALQMAAQAMTGNQSIAVVDGCNRFDVHALSRFARIRKIDPTEFLNRIYISRGFTCYQMEQAIAWKLPNFMNKVHSRTALIFGLLDTFYDEQASVREV